MNVAKRHIVAGISFFLGVRTDTTLPFNLPVERSLNLNRFEGTLLKGYPR